MAIPMSFLSPPMSIPYRLKVPWDPNGGYIATVNIPEGFRILCERPLIVLPHEGVSDIDSFIGEQFTRLYPDEQQQILCLPNLCRGPPALTGIVITSSLQDRKCNRVYPTASGMRHACLPNTMPAWNADKGYLTLHALRAIAAGEEITIPRCLNLSAKQRHECLKYRCTCQVCLLPPPLLKRSDHRRRFLNWIEAEFSGAKAISHGLKHALGIWQLAVHTAKIEYGPVANLCLSRYYAEVCATAATFGDIQRATVFAQRAYFISVLVRGEDHPFTAQAKRFFHFPNTLWAYFAAEHAAALAPTCSPPPGSPAFEEWLWSPSLAEEAARS